jgi:cobalt/nickel transport protein
MSEYRRLWIGLLALALLSPVGLYLPSLFAAGAAWGEWGLDEIRQMLGYAPAGMEKSAEIWKAPLPDYALPGQEGAPLSRLSLSYIFSAFLGMGICAGGAYLIGRWLARRKV